MLYFFLWWNKFFVVEASIVMVFGCFFIISYSSCICFFSYRDCFLSYRRLYIFFLSFYCIMILRRRTLGQIITIDDHASVFLELWDFFQSQLLDRQFSRENSFIIKRIGCCSTTCCFYFALLQIGLLYNHWIKLFFIVLILLEILRWAICRSIICCNAGIIAPTGLLAIQLRHVEGESAGLRSLAYSVSISLRVWILLWRLISVDMVVSVLNVFILCSDIILLRLRDKFVLISGLGFDFEPRRPVQLHSLTKCLLRYNLVISTLMHKRSFFGDIKIFVIELGRVPLLDHLVMLHLRTIDSFYIFILIIIATDKFMIYYWGHIALNIVLVINL